jgi:hypothetical protein
MQRRQWDFSGLLARVLRRFTDTPIAALQSNNEIVRFLFRQKFNYFLIEISGDSLGS